MYTFPLSLLLAAGTAQVQGPGRVRHVIETTQGGEKHQAASEVHPHPPRGRTLPQQHALGLALTPQVRMCLGRGKGSAGSILAPLPWTQLAYVWAASCAP